MTDELRRALETLADRGTPVGAQAAVDRAVAETTSARPWPRVLLAAAVVLALVGAAAVYADSRPDEVSWSVGSTDDPLGPQPPLNLLLVGTEGKTADAIVVVQTDPAAKRVAFLSVPPDLWIEWEQDRIADLFITPDQLTRAVHAATDVPIHHYAQVDFDGFRAVVDAVGGVGMRFAAPARDQTTGFQADAGCVRLDGGAALAFVRSRHYETLVDGRWQPDPTIDAGRTLRQQQFLLALAHELADLGRDPVRVNRLLKALVDNVQFDRGFSTHDLRGLAAALRTADPNGIETAVATGVRQQQSTAPAAVDC